MRVKDNTGIWSSAVTKYFIIPRIVEAATDIAEREYWLDGKIVARASLGNSPEQVSLTDLNVGLHTYSMRVKDNTGIWSSAVTKYFIVPRAVETATNIVEREYWIDGKTVARAVLNELPAQIDLTELSGGLHSYSMRVKDNTGIWSSAVTKYFIVPRADELAGTTIARYAYSFDDADSTTTGVLSGTSGLVLINIGALTEGEHVISWRIGDSKGAWSELHTDTFTFVRTELKDEMITLAQDSFVYSGEEFTPAVTVNDGKKELSAPDEYTVAYTENLDAGTATVTVIAADNSAYKGKATAQFTIVKADPVVTMPKAKEGLVYSGEAQALIEAGSAQGGEMQYSTDGETYSTTLPVAVQTGCHTVWYRVIGDKNHNDVPAATLSVKISADKTALNAVIGEANAYYGNILADYADIAVALKTAVDAAQAMADNADASQADVDAAASALALALQQAKDDVLAVQQLAADKAAYEAYKTQKLDVADTLAAEGDSEACLELISAAKTAIEALTYDEAKSLDDNKNDVDAIIEQLTKDLAAQRDADKKAAELAASRQQLADSIAAANAFYDSISGTEAYTVIADTLLAAIEEAQMVLDNENATKEEIDAAIAILTAALEKAKEDVEKTDGIEDLFINNPSLRSLKVVIDGRIYILFPDGRIYDILGNAVDKP